MISCLIKQPSIIQLAILPDVSLALQRKLTLTFHLQYVLICVLYYMLPSCTEYSKLLSKKSYSHWVLMLQKIKFFSRSQRQEITEIGFAVGSYTNPSLSLKWLPLTASICCILTFMHLPNAMPLWSIPLLQTPAIWILSPKGPTPVLFFSKRIFLWYSQKKVSSPFPESSWWDGIWLFLRAPSAIYFRRQSCSSVSAISNWSVRPCP